MLGAAEDVAEAATDLAESAEIFFYVLIGITLLRWIPYRWWRLTHKLLGIPFAMACWHFFTVQKPYANGDPWGLWFNVIMAAGLLAYVIRVVGRDVLARGVRYRIASAEKTGTTTALTLAPVGRKLEFEAGQFAFIKVQAPGMSEPHALTIASAPSEDELRFFIRELGDWTRKLCRRDLVGTVVLVEGPYGEFRPTDPNKPNTVWVAGGVGITPFLAALGDTHSRPESERPTLLYSVRDRSSATAIEVLEKAASEGRINLHVYDSAESNRLSPQAFRQHISETAEETHIAMCGPSSLVNEMAAVARSLGIRGIESEDFDIRRGFGPDLSVPIDDFVGRGDR